MHLANDAAEVGNKKNLSFLKGKNQGEGCDVFFFPLVDCEILKRFHISISNFDSDNDFLLLVVNFWLSLGWV